MAMLRALRDTFRIVECDEQIIHQAMDAKFSDVEDAVQYFSALRVGAACMVSRNPRHFLKSSLPILSPHEFFSASNLALHAASRRNRSSRCRKPSGNSSPRRSLP